MGKTIQKSTVLILDQQLELLFVRFRLGKSIYDADTTLALQLEENYNRE